jgi:hypothetical protein
VWDAMCLHDVKNFQKEEQIKKYAYRDRQKQLKDFLDKQVSDHKNKIDIEKNKDLSEYQHMVHKMNQFDQVQNQKNISVYNKLQENQKYLDQALIYKKSDDVKSNMEKTFERLSLLNQIKDIANKEQLSQSFK